ncbi:MAG TPA: DUF512 domain-containing protein [Patescibacteria group bacterium]|nr:DUF512 domain-containing protein [Patescibacteria group bacterium]
MVYRGVIAQVVPGSIADELGVKPGDILLSINGQPIKDLIDLSFAVADENIELVIEKESGEQELYEFEKDYDENLGIEFTSAVFDRVRSCANHCVFCFVDQMPTGLRETLYVKDDDYRLSFLYGNFITLTNMTPEDMRRIQQLHLSPLYVSVHTTDGGLRTKMLGIPQAASIMEQLNALIEQGIEIHTQVVLCPGINDGEHLKKTMDDLFALHPQVVSLAIVPVGLTKFREQCYPLQKFTPAGAREIVRMVEKRQADCFKDTGNHFVYLSDEFYLNAGRPIPEAAQYDEFPQLENGVGLVRCFLDEWDAVAAETPVVTSGLLRHVDVVCGISAAKILKSLFAKIAIPNLQVRIVAVENQFFGPDVTVTGLLTGQDIINTLLREPSPKRDAVILPGVALRSGETVFLDNMDIKEVTAAIGVPVHIAYSAGELYRLLNQSTPFTVL